MVIFMVMRGNVQYIVMAVIFGGAMSGCWVLSDSVTHIAGTTGGVASRAGHRRCGEARFDRHDGDDPSFWILMGMQHHSTLGC